MENILKNPGLQHIMNTSLIFLEKSIIASFQLVNQDCKNIVDDPIFSQGCTKGPDWKLEENNSKSSTWQVLNCNTLW